MADNNMDKEALKAQKEAEKAAKKAKEERIKQSKPKKEGTIVSRSTGAVKRFCKDFVGTCKKIAWPTGKQVIKNAGVVLATIAVIALAVFAVDWALTEVFDLAKEGAISLGEQFAEKEGTTAGEDEATNLSDLLGELTSAEDASAQGEAESLSTEEITDESASEVEESSEIEEASEESSIAE